MTLRIRAWGLASVAAVLAASPAAAQTEAADPASSGEAPSAVAIAEAIEDELAIDPIVPSAAIDVTVGDGVATLEGRACCLLAKERAVRLAQTVRGVRAVIDLQEVAQPTEVGDVWIRDEVRRSLREDPALEREEFRVHVQNGVVTLDGEVESLAEKRIAVRAAKRVRGVTEVTDDIAIALELTRPDEEIRADVIQSLRWNPLVDDGLVRVEVDEGVVTLSGIVESAAARRKAIEAAEVAGAMSIEADELDVARWLLEGDHRTRADFDVSDAGIRAAVEAALERDPRVAPFDIEVEVAGGAVTLRGSVDNLAARRAAERDAANTVGVWEVHDRLKIRPTYDVDDDTIQARIGRTLVRDPHVDRFAITIEVENGVVRLTGTVDNERERAQAEDLVTLVRGVLDVENRLLVAVPPAAHGSDPYVDDWWRPDDGFRRVRTQRYAAYDDLRLERAIREELWWSPFVDSDRIEVEVQDGIATLRGEVHDKAEMSAATRNALDGGATRVENRLTIEGRSS